MTEARRFTAEGFDELSQILERERASPSDVAALRQAAQQARVLAGIREFAKVKELRWHETFMLSGHERDDAKADAFADVLTELDRLEAAPPPAPQE